MSESTGQTHEPADGTTTTNKDHAFTVTGLDFAGPIQIKQGYSRKPVIIKAYVCVFICFSTKAVHLELCADLTTTEFMEALRRFVGEKDFHSTYIQTTAQIFKGQGTK